MAEILCLLYFFLLNFKKWNFIRWVFWILFDFNSWLCLHMVEINLHSFILIEKLSLNELFQLKRLDLKNHFSFIRLHEVIYLFKNLIHELCVSIWNKSTLNPRLESLCIRDDLFLFRESLKCNAFKKQFVKIKGTICQEFQSINLKMKELTFT